MFKHVLVPLDGSHLAEWALPASLHLAQKLQAALTLLHLIEHRAPAVVHGERHLTQPAEATAYLEQVAQPLRQAGLAVATHVHTQDIDDVSQSIAAHVRELAPDLIVMCTHGRSGLHALVFGRIAQRVVARGPAPVLLIHPQAQAAPTFACQRLLVALDGTPEHEPGLAVAATFAQACGAALHLLVVIPTPETLPDAQAVVARLLPGAMSTVLAASEQAVVDYLQRQVSALKAQGLAVTAEIGHGDPATAIVKTAQTVGVEVVVMATHGKAGLQAFWEGSVAPKVSNQSQLPILLVPIPGNQND